MRKDIKIELVKFKSYHLYLQQNHLFAIIEDIRCKQTELRDAMKKCATYLNWVLKHDELVACELFQ